MSYKWARNEPLGAPLVLVNWPTYKRVNLYTTTHTSCNKKNKNKKLAPVEMGKKGGDALLQRSFTKVTKYEQLWEALRV